MKVLLIYAMSDIEGYLPFYLPRYLLIEVVLTGMISYAIINIRHIRKVNRIPMSDALKNRE
jgi:putative ABC transport system permease protein